MKIDEYYRDKTTFTLHHGLYRFKRIPFELENTSTTFQSTMYVIAASKGRQRSFSVLLKSPADHTEHICRVSRLLYKEEVTFKLEN